MKKKKEIFKNIIIVLEIIVLLIITAVYTVGKVWISETVDNYVYPEVIIVSDETIKLNGSINLPEIELNENETVYFTISNSDILSLDNEKVTAKAVFPYCWFRAYIMEKQRYIKPDPYSDITVFGYDISCILNSIYYRIREFLNIELKKENNNPRVLKIYQYNLSVEEPDYSQLVCNTSITITEGQKAELDFSIDKNHNTENFIISNDKALSILYEDNKYVIEALTPDKVRIYIPLKKKIMVSESEYSEYSNK